MQIESSYQISCTGSGLYLLFDLNILIYSKLQLNCLYFIVQMNKNQIKKKRYSTFWHDTLPHKSRIKMPAHLMKWHSYRGIIQRIIIYSINKINNFLFSQFIMANRLIITFLFLSCHQFIFFCAGRTVKTKYFNAIKVTFFMRWNFSFSSFYFWSTI